MRGDSMVSTAFRILRNSKIVWSLVFTENLFIAVGTYGNLGGSALVLLYCCVLLAWPILLLILPLAVTIALHSGYLDKPIGYRELLAETRKYTLRWIGIFAIVYLPFIAICILFVILFRRIIPTFNYPIFSFCVSFLGTFFVGFLGQYFRLEMIRNNLGVRDALQHGSEVWARRQYIKAAIALLSSLIGVAVALLIVSAQKGFSLALFGISEQEYAALLRPLIPHFLPYVYAAVAGPILNAFMMSAYFGDLDIKRASPAGQTS